MQSSNNIWIEKIIFSKNSMPNIRSIKIQIQIVLDLESMRMVSHMDML